MKKESLPRSPLLSSADPSASLSFSNASIKTEKIVAHSAHVQTAGLPPKIEHSSEAANGPPKKKRKRSSPPSTSSLSSPFDSSPSLPSFNVAGIPEEVGAESSMVVRASWGPSSVASLHSTPLPAPKAATLPLSRAADPPKKARKRKNGSTDDDNVPAPKAATLALFRAAGPPKKARKRKNRSTDDDNVPPPSKLSRLSAPSSVVKPNVEVNPIGIRDEAAKSGSKTKTERKPRKKKRDRERKQRQSAMGGNGRATNGGKEEVRGIDSGIGLPGLSTTSLTVVGESIRQPVIEVANSSTSRPNISSSSPSLLSEDASLETAFSLDPHLPQPAPLASQLPLCAGANPPSGMLYSIETSSPSPPVPTEQATEISAASERSSLGEEQAEECVEQSAEVEQEQNLLVGIVESEQLEEITPICVKSERIEEITPAWELELSRAVFLDAPLSSSEAPQRLDSEAQRSIRGADKASGVIGDGTIRWEIYPPALSSPPSSRPQPTRRQKHSRPSAKRRQPVPTSSLRRSFRAQLDRSSLSSRSRCSQSTQEEAGSHSLRRPRPPSPVIIEGEEHYEVERIVDSRRQRRDEVEYKVEWSGYEGADQFSWLPFDEVKHLEGALHGFFAANPHKPGAPAEPVILAERARRKERSEEATGLGERSSGLVEGRECRDDDEEVEEGDDDRQEALETGGQTCGEVVVREEIVGHFGGVDERWPSSGRTGPRGEGGVVWKKVFMACGIFGIFGLLIVQ
ncbi:hypothetical protein B9479_007718 [Cryptococcus floricola]|uniref:Chromo domain-containing protein n=1 Tax=Cryptococcus floricola TaxID=2591691 RepID=A0A5D3AM23_9TREE|nr:hypothetical protein B9479_007718 [Cryptococcus floricola]